MSWMAWTWPVAAFFSFVVLAIIATGIWEVFHGVGERKGAWGLETTWGDRLFISLLGTGFIMLIWIAFVSTHLWAPLGISVGYSIYIYKWV